jgi:hypothetical protein
MSFFSDLFHKLFGKKQPQQPVPTPAPAPMPTTPPTLVVPPTTPEPTPPSPVAPPIGASDTEAPWGYTTKPDGTKVKNLGPNAGWGWDYEGSPIPTAALYKRWKNLTDASIDHGQARYTGPVPYGQVSDAEAQFLTYVSSNYRFDPSKVRNQSDAWFAILSGTAPQINTVIARGDTLTKAGYDPNQYPQNGRMRGYVDDVANGRLTVKVLSLN